VPQRALQSVHIRHPCPRIRKNTQEILKKTFTWKKREDIDIMYLFFKARAKHSRLSDGIPGMWTIRQLQFSSRYRVSQSMRQAVMLYVEKYSEFMGVDLQSPHGGGRYWSWKRPNRYTFPPRHVGITGWHTWSALHTFHFHLHYTHTHTLHFAHSVYI